MVQLAQRLLQRLECLLVLLQCLQLLLEADLPVHRLDEDTDSHELEFLVRIMNVFLCIRFLVIFYREAYKEMIMC